MSHALNNLTAEEIIEQLELEPHPEGGFFRETFREESMDGERSSGTAILFLLAKGQVSRWHRVDATEIWHFYAGDALELGLSQEGNSQETLQLGLDLGAQQLPQQIVPKGWWQQARTLGDWTLVGCTVSPAFEFSGFEMADEGWEPGHTGTS